MSGGGLGRIASPDERDRAYPIRALFKAPVTRTFRYWAQNGSWLNQGNTSTCVGHAWAHYTNDSPIAHPDLINPYAIYREAAQIDQWPGNDNGDLNFGTSVRAGAQALQTRGIIAEYRWAWDVETVVDALLTKGPVVMGTNWYTDMFETDAKGFLHVSGSVEGGHAYVLNGVNRKRGILRIKNSWGRSWGWGSGERRGFAFISIEEMDRLIKENGEACLTLKVKANPPT